MSKEQLIEQINKILDLSSESKIVPIKELINSVESTLSNNILDTKEEIDKKIKSNQESVLQSIDSMSELFADTLISLEENYSNFLSTTDKQQAQIEKNAMHLANMHDSIELLKREITSNRHLIQNLLSSLKSLSDNIAQTPPKDTFIHDVNSDYFNNLFPHSPKDVIIHEDGTIVGG